MMSRLQQKNRDVYAQAGPRPPHEIDDYPAAQALAFRATLEQLRATDIVLGSLPAQYEGHSRSFALTKPVG